MLIDVINCCTCKTIYLQVCQKLIVLLLQLDRLVQIRSQICQPRLQLHHLDVEGIARLQVEDGLTVLECSA